MIMLGVYLTEYPKFECLPPLLFFLILFSLIVVGIAVTPHENNDTKSLTLSLRSFYPNFNFKLP